MTVELITGFAGTPHIGSDDIGAFQAGLVGPGDYALTTGNQLKATMSNANTIAVQSGDAVLNGRHVHLTGTTTATVQSGTQGQKRNDIAVLRYSKNTTSGVETCQLVVIKGTPTTGTPADPAHNTGSILDGVATHDMPLYRVSLNGITVGTLVPLFNVLKPMKDMWDSLTPIRSGKKTRRSPAASLTSCPMRNTVPWSAGATLVAMWLFSRPSPPAWIRRWSHATTCPIRSSAPSRSAPSRTSRWMSGLR